METRRLGRTELQVTPLGYGLAEIDRQDKGGRDISGSARVLEAVLDSGINFLDTASGYGITEELIGESISHRRTSTSSRPSSAPSMMTTAPASSTKSLLPRASTKVCEG